MKKLRSIRLYIRNIFQLCKSRVINFGENLIILTFGRNWKVYLCGFLLRYANVSSSRSSVSSEVTSWCLSRCYCRTRTIRRSTLSTIVYSFDNVYRHFYVCTPSQFLLQRWLTREGKCVTYFLEYYFHGGLKNGADKSKNMERTNILLI